MTSDSGNSRFAPKPPQPKNWKELFAITGNLAGVPMAEIENGRLDWKYEFSKDGLHKCGRKGCERKHGIGWLVALPEGRFVNVGHICAAKYAENKAAWSAKQDSYVEERRAEARKQAAIEAQAAAVGALTWLSESNDLERAKRLSSSFFESAKGPFLDSLRSRADRMDAVVTTERERTVEEIASSRVERIDAKGQTRVSQMGRFETIRLGNIAGLSAMRALHDPCELERNLLRLAAWLKNCDVSNMSGPEIKGLHMQTRELAPIRQKLQESVASTLRFFEPSNLTLLMRLKEARAQGMREILVGADDRVTIRRRDGWS